MICISHGEDVDGLVCAILLRQVKNAFPILVSYEDFEDKLRAIKSPLDEVFICDLGIREALCSEIIRISRFAKVTVVDHHPTSEEVLNKLKHFGIKIVYSHLDCASVLLYNLFKDKLGRNSARLAAYAAISDQFDSGPLASKIISEFDRLFIQYEALILTYALDHQEEDNFRSLIFEELNRFTFPHKIKGLPETALAHLDYLVELIRILPVRAKKLDRVAYIEGEKESSKGTIASLLIDSLGTAVGLCYKQKSDDTVNISIRAKKNFLFHLGKITKKLAEKYHGFGGGHTHASGAKIPQKNLMNFINDLEKEVKSLRID